MSGVNLLLGGVEENAHWQWRQNPTIFSARHQMWLPQTPFITHGGSHCSMSELKLVSGLAFSRVRLVPPPFLAFFPLLLFETWLWAPELVQRMRSDGLIPKP